MRVLMTLIIFLALAPLALAQEWFIFANDGQDQDQQDLDEFQCIRIARDRTGFDPMATPTATSAPPATQGGAVRGAARGAALGAAVGAVGRGSASSGAAVGAASGGLMGGMRRADSGRQQQQWSQQQAANYQRERNDWNRAFSACMQSRGYTVG